MALYKKSSVGIPPVEGKYSKLTEDKELKLKALLDSIEPADTSTVYSKDLTESQNKDANNQLGKAVSITGKSDKEAPFSLSAMQKIGLVGAGLLGITAGGSVYNYKTLNDYQNAMKKIYPSFKGDTKKAKAFKAIKDATKTTFTGKTKIPFGGGVVLEKPIYTFGDNIAKTLKLGINPIENFYKKDGSINPIKIEKPINVEQQTVTPDKPNVKINTAKSGYTEGPFPIETKPTVAPEANKKVFSKTKGRVSKFQKMMEADVFPSPTNASTSGNLYSGINPDSPAVKKVLKYLGKGAKTLLNNAGAIGTAGAYMMNEQESVDKYGVGAKAVVDNIINTSVDIVNPLNYLRMASYPTNLIAEYGGDNIISNTAKKVSGVYDRVIDTAEKSVSDNFNKRMQEEKELRQSSEDKKIYKKMKSTPDYTISDIQKAVMYGDTKRSGLEALETISASTGIPIDKLLSEGRKMWSKRKK